MRPASDWLGGAPHRALLPSDIIHGPWDALGRPGTPWEHPCGWRAPEQPVTPTPQGAGIALGQQAEEPVLPPSHGVPLGDPAHCTIV